MDPVIVGLLGIVLLLVLFFLNMPVSFAMAFVGFAGFGYLVSVIAVIGACTVDDLQGGDLCS
jgi:hypothetical protein